MQASARELEALLAVARGLDMAATAQLLGISPDTVDKYLTQVRERYGAPNNEAAIASLLDQEDVEEAPLVRRNIKLTEEELDLLERIARGQKDRTMSAELFMSIRILNVRVARLRQKLGAVNRCNAVYLGYSYGLLTGYRAHQTRSPRKSEIAALTAVAQSRGSDEAAATIGLKPVTVKAYLRRSLRRLGARTTPQAVAIAIRRGEIVCPRTGLTTARSLTDRERRIMAFVADGLPNAEIARRMDLRNWVFDRDLANVLRQLQAKSRSHAVYLLFQQGVLH